jgi:hypothetical protein
MMKNNFMPFSIQVPSFSNDVFVQRNYFNYFSIKDESETFGDSVTRQTTRNDVDHQNNNSAFKFW